MVCLLRFGHSTNISTGRSRARYNADETLVADSQAEMAAYYSGEREPEEMTPAQRLGKAVSEGAITFEDALADLVARAQGDAEAAAERHVENTAHLTAWLDGKEAPDLGRLAEYAAHPDALVGVTPIEDRLNEEFRVAIAAAEAPPLSPEARALHGLSEPDPVPDYLRGIPLADLEAQRDKVLASWDAAWSEASFKADVRETTSLREELSGAVEQIKVRQSLAKEVGAAATVRADLSPAMAKLLGLDPTRAATEDEMANIFCGLRSDGQPIEGKKRHGAVLSVAEVFGITDHKVPPTGEALEHILAGRRIDGTAPVARAGSFRMRLQDKVDATQAVPDGYVPLPERIVDGARKRFLTAMGVAAGRDPTDAEMARIRSGAGATIGYDFGSCYGREILSKRPPISYAEIVLSPDKSLSVAWALAPSAAERTVLLRIHTDAVAETMRYIEKRAAFMGTWPDRGRERGEIAWVTYQHYTSRPTAEIVSHDEHGQEYTEFRNLPLKHPDPHIHSHIVVPSVVLTESGRVGAIDTDYLTGPVKEFSGVYQAHIAKFARAHGIEMKLGSEEAPRLVGVPTHVRDHFKKRSEGAREAAMRLAAENGKDWDTLSSKERIGLINRSADALRNNKNGPSDFGEWRRQAKEDLGYKHESVLHPDRVKPELGPAERREVAYHASLPLVEDAFAKRAVISGQDMRDAAVHGLILGGIENPEADISAVTAAYREHGIKQNGEQVSLLWGKGPKVRGKDQWRVSTDLHISQERDLIALARTASADKSAALSPEQIDRAVVAFLARNPRIDPNGAQWKAQREMLDRLATGGRLAIGIGSAGSGKSTILAPAVDAWKRDGRKVYGIALAWRAAGALADSDIPRDDRAAIAAFNKRVESGVYKLDRNTVVVVDEVSLIGTKQFLDLARLQEKHGFQLVGIGDPKQCQSVEAGAVVDLIDRALPGTIPAVLSAIRQRTEREREITGLFRAGNAAEAIALKREDKTAELVAGGRDATIKRVADLWWDRHEANADDPAFSLTVSVATHADARDVAGAIRAKLQESEQIGPDVLVVKASNNAGEEYDMALAVGDKITSLRRICAGQYDQFAVNGSVLTVTSLNKAGIGLMDQDGREVRLAWKALSDGGGPLKIGPAYAATIDSIQGATAGEHINAMVSGSDAIQCFKNYVAQSRHRVSSWMVINEAAERRQISQRQPIGTYVDIKQEDIWRNVSANLSRQDAKMSALDFQKGSAIIWRGGVTNLFSAKVNGEQRAGDKSPVRQTHTDAQDIERVRVEKLSSLGPVVQRAMGGQEAQQQKVHRQRGPRM